MLEFLKKKKEESRPPGEFERGENGEWVRVSNIGDDIGLDFFHDDVVRNGVLVQETIIRDENGNENVMSNGRRWFRGGVVRSAFEGDWQTLYSDWRWGWGVENSIFTGGHFNNILIQESNWLQNSIQEFINSGNDRAGRAFNWDSGLRATWNGNNCNMHLVFMGSYNVSFYRLGTRTLVFVLDDKTRESGLGHLPFISNYSREEGMPNPFPWSQERTRMMTTTFQRYLFFVDN